MKKLITAICLTTILSFSVFAQTSESELNQLRKQVGLPVSVTVLEKDISFPDLKTTKIFLAVKHNKSAAKDFLQQIDKWNQTEGNRHGRLEIVGKAEDADIIAAQYRFGTSRLVLEDSVGVKIGKTRDDGEDDDFVLSSAGNSNVKVERTVKTLKVPLYSYLLVRGQNSFWYVTYSRVDDAIESDDRFPERLLQSKLEDSLKNR